MDYSNQEFFKKMNELTGRTNEEINALYLNSGLTKHSEIRSFFMTELQLSYGYANTLVHLLAKTDGASMAIGKESEEILEEIYNNKKKDLREIHDAIMDRVYQFGEFEILPKKGYLSLKRKSQFATIGPKTNSRIEIGINLKGVVGTEKLIEQPKGSMCKFVVKIEGMKDVDAELFGWLKEAYLQSI